ncbi:MAG: Fe-S cluster assembly ATPase SufC [Candidatus Marinimicrobia bacterium]|jgi:Fe-S cluster assembly ATP-binding protein|nr:Fe-S cluster assembly ATPase SufC [Candidatus Neomarinimicrobiota bacterium]MDP6500675.1 Fe-S cluster assembly ATPase SufC [Candidatus Neomarinimicrobiota bacterium]|tara:strand:+ start:10959 stop:11696 length:738 start_codon:yes stop_codon:yes gene_type:complete
MLEIKNLHVSIDNKKILKGINLTIISGELHAIMGRNGSGKSTLSHVIAGKEGYEIEGEILFNGESLLGKSPEERALAGIFMSFQYPVVISGVNNTYFLKAALNAKLKANGQPELDAMDFLSLIKEKIKLVGMDESYLSRNVNDGFSGGEKKQNEILQLLTLEPTFAILDETDSGLDIDALKIIANGVNQYRNSERGILAITHYQRLLDYMKPDVVHAMIDGKIVKTGDMSLAKELEKKGYSWLID